MSAENVANGAAGRNAAARGNPVTAEPLAPERILSAARVLVRGVLKPQNPSDAVIEAVAKNVASALPGYGPAAGSPKLRSSVPRCDDPRLPHWLVKNVSLVGPAEAKGRRLFMHPSLELAEAEARRLARQHPGQTFVVYASVGVFHEEQAAPEPGQEGTAP